MKKIIDFWITGNVSDEDYLSAKEDMYKNNVMMLRVLSSIATAIFVLCTVLGLTVPNMHSKLVVYIVGLTLTVLIFLAAMFLKNRKIHIICMMLLDVMLLGVGLLITLVSAPEQLTVTLIPVALLVPLFFDVKPCVFLTVVGCADLIYAIWAPIVKPSSIIALDMVDVLAFSMAGITIATVITKVKIERYAYANKIRKIALMDGLTACYNRKAYADDVSEMNDNYPSNFVYISLDVNGLKVVNDSLGHEAGDEIIIGASQCMLNCFAQYGKVYRTGGDEFTVVICAGSDKLKKCLAEFDRQVANWRGEIVESLSVSYGYVCADEIQGMPVFEVAAIADKRMYEAKARYYSEKGIDRRGQLDAHTALCNLYTKILKINITDDSYKIIDMPQDEQTKEMGLEDTVSEWFKAFGKKGNIHPDDLAQYLELTELSYISEYFKSGKTSLDIFYRRKFGAEFKQAMMEMIPATDYSEKNQSLFLYVKNIEK